MAARVFDTYMPGSVEPLVSFINSLSDGRILCLAILVSSISSSSLTSIFSEEPSTSHYLVHKSSVIDSKRLALVHIHCRYGA